MTKEELGEFALEMYEALKAYESLDNQRMSCEECEDQLERAPEACGECFPFADAARCKMMAVLSKVDREDRLDDAQRRRDLDLRDRL